MDISCRSVCCVVVEELSQRTYLMRKINQVQKDKEVLLKEMAKVKWRKENYKEGSRGDGAKLEHSTILGYAPAKAVN